MSVLRWSCALSVALAIAAPPRPVHAEVPPTEETPPTQTPSTTDSIHEEMVKLFIEHFQAGKLYYNKGQYALAAERFEQAFAAVPAEAALLNVALARERAGDDVAAAIAARRYLELPACDTPGIDKALCAASSAEVATMYERLMKRVAKLRLDITPGVEVREIRINNRVTAEEDFPILVAPGRVDVEYTGLNPGEKRQRVIEVRAGEESALVVDSFDAPPRVPDTRQPPSGKPRSRAWAKPAFFVGVGLTAASGIALATTGALTIVYDKRFDRQQQLHNDSLPLQPDGMGGFEAPEYPYPADLEAKRDRLHRAANVLTGVTAGLAVVTVVLAVVAYSRKKPTGSTRASTRTRLQYTGTGLALSW
jgi:hypothetical protein